MSGPPFYLINYFSNLVYASTIFIILRALTLAVGSRGYKPIYQPHKPTSTIITYDDHGYAGDVSITAGSIYPRPQNTTRKLHLFSQYTGLQRETSKCEATRALWAHGNPLNHNNKTLLQEQINFVTFVDGTYIRYLPPNKSCTMLGIHVNPMMDIRENFIHITKDV